MTFSIAPSMGPSNRTNRRRSAGLALARLEKSRSTMTRDQARKSFGIPSRRKKTSALVAELAKVNIIVVRVASADGVDRPYTLLDDMVVVVFTPIEGISKADVNIKVLQGGVGALLDFYWYGYVLFPGETDPIKIHTKLRACVRQSIVNTHTVPISILYASGATTLPTLTVATDSNASGVVAAMVPLSPEARLVELRGILALMKGEQFWVHVVTEFVASHAKEGAMSTKFRRCYQQAQAPMLEGLVGISGGKKVSQTQLVDGLIMAVTNLVPDEWCDHVALVFAAAGVQWDVFAEFNMGVYSDLKQVGQFAQLKVDIIPELLLQFGSGPDRISVEDLTATIDNINLIRQDNGELFGLFDCCIQSGVYHAAWSAIIAVLSKPTSSNPTILLKQVAAAITKKRLKPYTVDIAEIKALFAMDTAAIASPAAAPILADTSGAAPPGEVVQSGGEHASTPVVLDAEAVVESELLTKLGPTFKKLTHIRTSLQLPGDQLTLVQSVHFQRELEQFIWHKTQLAATGTGTFKPDRGVDHLIVDGAAKDSKVYLLPTCKVLNLNFAGKVITLPVKGAIWVAKAFETDYYVEKGGHDSIDKDTPYKQTKNIFRFFVFSL